MAGAEAGRLAGRRVLVVEDEYYIAADIRRALEAVAAIVVGPTGAVAVALELAGATLDAAILDVHLDGGDVYPVADRLSEGAVPYLFLTGYDGWALPERFRDAPRLAKPVAAEQVIDAAGALLAGGNAG